MNWKSFTVGFICGFGVMLGLAMYNGTKFLGEIQDEYQEKVDSLNTYYQHQLDSSTFVADSAKLEASRVDTVIIEIEGNELQALRTFDNSLDTLHDDTLKSAIIADLFY